MSANLELNRNYQNYAPVFTPDVIEYPEEDGEPLAETDFHVDLIAYLRKALETFFADRTDVYVSGCIMFYYVEGVPEEVVSPDVMVCFGVPKGERRTYKLWEEKAAPTVVIEIASRKTSKKDRTEKLWLYEQLGVEEYFIFNPEYPKTIPALLAYRLENEEYRQLKIENNRVLSEQLGLELVDTGTTLRLFNPKTQQFLPTFAELHAEAQAAAVRAETAIARAAAAEAEIERLKAELAKLKREK